MVNQNLNQVVNEPVQTQTLTEHEQAMVDKVDALENKVTTETANDIQAVEEVKLAGKYNSVEDLEKAYKELEKKLGQPKVEETPTTEIPSTKAEAEEVVADKGIDLDNLYQEYSANDGLSDDTYKMLESKGITKANVDAYIEGQKAIVDKYIGDMKALTGGTDNYNKMIEWATNELSGDEQQAFNLSLQNKHTAMFAINGLYARYKANAEPSFIGSGSTATTSGGYNSKAEMIADMKTEKYRKDPAFRAEVQRKLAKSKI